MEHGLRFSEVVIMLLVWVQLLLLEGVVGHGVFGVAQMEYVVVLYHHLPGVQAVMIEKSEGWFLDETWEV